MPGIAISLATEVCVNVMVNAAAIKLSAFMELDMGPPLGILLLLTCGVRNKGQSSVDLSTRQARRFDFLYQPDERIVGRV
jgi:hypothetical protein